MALFGFNVLRCEIFPFSAFFFSYFILKLYKLSWRESDEKTISKNKDLMRRINKIEWKESNLTFC